MLARIFVVIAVVVLGAACVTAGRVQSKENVASMPSASAAAAPRPSVPRPPESPPLPCVSFALADHTQTELPFFLPQVGVVLTRVVKPCGAIDGSRGFVPQSSWMAMGVPCSGGEGRIDWLGSNYLRPKQASFILANDCQMAPGDVQKTRAAVGEALASDVFAQMGMLVAYTPLTVQYWEIETDADVGTAVDMRSNASLDLWGKMLKGYALPVKLYGRENSWVSGGVVYEVLGEISVTSKNRFRLGVQSIKGLTNNELAAVRARCEALRPARNCASSF